MFFKRFTGLFSNAIGIDLGTANTLVYLKGEGIVTREPSVVAVNKNTKKVIAVGKEAKRMIDRAPPTIAATRPMRDGVISDFDVCEQMLRYFIGQTARKTLFTHLAVVIAVPYGINPVSKRAVMDSAYRAGADEACTLAEPIASALGVGLPVGEPAGSMIIDIGGGTTEVAILSLGDIAYAESIGIGGDEFDRSIMNFVRNKYNLAIGSLMAEEIKIQIGSAMPLDEELRYEVKGRDTVTGLPRSEYISSDEVRQAIENNLSNIVESVKRALEHSPPELVGDLIDRGITLAGGGSQLRGIDKLISDATGVPAFVGDDPLCAVANGTGHYIESDNWRSLVSQ
ncbi:MAG: rod shape-determining protein [Puniceicoccales bacterium]|jgi:rod shape-determining protein MreB|nr:rod shape-determining protein [Puniceicoccales bacterium]